MIIDLEKFIQREREYWEGLEVFLNHLDKGPCEALDVPELRRFHYLYERTSADLAKLATFAGERDTRAYLEALVARAYGQIHETREEPHRLRPLNWFFVVFPETFRRHIRAFHTSLAVVLLGCLFGGMVVAMDPSAREILMPFKNLLGSPTERVSNEESILADHLSGVKARGAAFYITHNTRVSLFVMTMGITWGVGSVILLFSNGVMLGAVLTDYIVEGQGEFMVAWLLPHGSVEIPAILLAGQAGLVLAGAIIGWGVRKSLGARLREISSDLVTLVAGVVVFLVWAGIVESFLSQYHEPVLPYSFKTAFGIVQLVLVVLFLWRSGRGDLRNIVKLIRR